MTQDNRHRVCTVDHAGKQRDAIGWNDHEFWLAVVRRRKAAMSVARLRQQADGTGRSASQSR